MSKTADDTLIFIPDISGFTSFVNTTEIQHARHIIEELLEILIDANEIELVLSEIEGDALLFYRKGEAPTADEILEQIKKMHADFHAHLKKYDSFRICNCGACCSATKLKLKFVAHYGETADKRVKEHSKLFGRDVIVAHRLLKNEVPGDEYGLFSEGLQESGPSWAKLHEKAWSEINHSEEKYDFGKVKYCYLDLEELMDLVPDPKVEDYSVAGATKNIFESEALIKAPIDIVFDMISDFKARAEFVEGQVDADQMNHEIFQNGSVHRCVFESGDPHTFVSHDYQIDSKKITFVESNHKLKMVAVWTLEAVADNETRISVHNFMPPNIFKVFLFNLLMRKKMTEGMKKSWENLQAYCDKLQAEDHQHTNRIVLPGQFKA